MASPAPTIGIDIGGTNIRAARVDASGAILDHRAVRTMRDPQALVECLAGLVTELDRPGIRAVGIGVPGRVDARRGTVLSGGYVDLSTLPFADLVRERTGKRIFIDNDCNMALVAESTSGAARGLSHVVMLTIGTGIGGAVLADGQILRGARTAGQLGHVTVRPDGELCNCGRRGCVETTSSGTALGRHIAAAGLPGDTTAAQLLTRADEGDAIAIGVLEAWAMPLRDAIDSLVAAFDPELVLLGGGLGEAACAALVRAPARSPWYQCPVSAVSLGDAAGVIGAALAGGREGT